MVMLTSWMIQTHFLGGLMHSATTLLWKLSAPNRPPPGIRRHFASTLRTCGGPWGKSTLGKAPGPKHSRTGADRVCWAAGLCSNRHFNHFAKVPAPVVGLLRGINGMVSRRQSSWWTGAGRRTWSWTWTRPKRRLLAFGRTSPVTLFFSPTKRLWRWSKAPSLWGCTPHHWRSEQQRLHFLCWMRRSYLPPSLGLLFPPPRT